MTEGERRINILIANVKRGKYTVAYLRDLLERGMRHVDCYGEKNIDHKFITNLACIEVAVKRIEQSRKRDLQ